MTEHIVYASPAMQIGKHVWRVVVSIHPLYAQRVTRYEWKKPDWRCGGYVISEGWRHYREWPTYDLNDGMSAGLPATLRTLWERYQPYIEEALGQEPSQSFMRFET